MRIEIDGVEYIPKSESVFPIIVTEESFEGLFGGKAIYHALKSTLACLGVSASQIPSYEEFSKFSFKAKVAMFTCILTMCKTLDSRGDD